MSGNQGRKLPYGEYEALSSFGFSRECERIWDIKKKFQFLTNFKKF